MLGMFSTSYTGLLLLICCTSGVLVPAALWTSYFTAFFVVILQDNYLYQYMTVLAPSDSAIEICAESMSGGYVITSLDCWRGILLFFIIRMCYLFSSNKLWGVIWRSNYIVRWFTSTQESWLLSVLAKKLGDYFLWVPCERTLLQLKVHQRFIH